MKKILIVFCLLFLLAGCKRIDRNNVSMELDPVFASVGDIQKYRLNNKMNYYEYYLPSDMAEETIDSDSIVLKYNDSRIIMNLNISGIINSLYYPNHINDDEGFFVDDYLIYSNSGTYKNGNGNNKQFVYKLYDYNDQWVVHMSTNDMNYYGTITAGDCKDITKHLLTMAINTNVENENVINDYSKKDVIDYQKKQINLFEIALPTSGELSVKLVDGAVVGDGIIPTEQDSEETSYEYGDAIKENTDITIDELPQE